MVQNSELEKNVVLLQNRVVSALALATLFAARGGGVGGLCGGRVLTHLQTFLQDTVDKDIGLPELSAPC